MVGLLDQFEHWLDELLNGALTAAFEDEVQPVEIVAAITREMDEHLQELTNGRLVAPNHFIVDLASHDYDRLKDYLKTLEAEFIVLATTHAESQNYSLTGDVVVSVMKDRDLDNGVFRISFEQVAMSTSSTLPATDINAPSIFIRGVSHPLTKPINRIGRSVDADIVINDPAISRLHAEITVGSEIILRDLNSTNGTWFNDERISEIVLDKNCKFKLGTIEVEYK
jgi:hypothetical protein